MVRRLNAPLPDPGSWRTTVAARLRTGDTIVTDQIGRVDSLAVVGGQVLVENWTGAIHVFELEAKVLAYVVTRPR